MSSELEWLNEMTNPKKVKICFIFQCMMVEFVRGKGWWDVVERVWSCRNSSAERVHHCTTFWWWAREGV
jgi:hypothetical protein